MINSKTEQKQEQEAPFMGPLPFVEQLSSRHKELVAKRQMLKSVSLECQSYRRGQEEDVTILGSTGNGSLNAQSLGLAARHARGGRRLKGGRHSIPRIERFYREVMCFDLLLQCPLKGIAELSPPKKVVLSSNSKKVIQDRRELIVGVSACLMISGQKCQTTRARKSIAGFKLREGSVLGCKVTLRGNSMYAFLDKLINLVLPRARALLINQAIDINGAYNIGISDPFLFVELEHHYDIFQSLQGFDIALVTSPRERGIAPLFWSGLQIFTG